ncbi:MAG: DUF2231 domain-containing protein [Actinobacteria bacterium]|nr:DUF2231 domain-containing protein [Actinomycetota bacterium]
MQLSYLIKGTPGHPSHPPLTDVTIGAYTAATALGVIGALGVSEGNLSKGWWLALLIGVVTSGVTSLTGLADWLEISRGTPMWRTATTHMIVNLAASALFVVTLVLGHGGYVDGEVSTGALVLNLIAFAFLSFGGWLGGSIVFVHGMRVLDMPDEPSGRAIAPLTPEKKAAQES